MSLPASLKISKKQTYKEAFVSGNKITTPNFKIYFSLNNNSQIGVVIPKKLMKLSHDRQRLKRRIHGEIINLNLVQGMVIVQLAKKVLPEIDLKELEVLNSIKM